MKRCGYIEYGFDVDGKTIVRCTAKTDQCRVAGRNPHRGELGRRAGRLRYDRQRMYIAGVVERPCRVSGHICQSGWTDRGSINNDRREHIKEIDPLIFAPAIERYILTGAASARVNIWKAWQ